MTLFEMPIVEPGLSVVRTYINSLPDVQNFKKAIFQLSVGKQEKFP